MSLGLKKDQRNGTEKSTSNVAPNLKELPQVHKAPPVKSGIDQRIQKVEELRSLTTKRQRTIDTLNQLRSFHFASDDTCMLTIADTQGNKFQTGNSNLLSMVKTYLEGVLNDKVSSLDDEIMGFAI